MVSIITRPAPDSWLRTGFLTLSLLLLAACSPEPPAQRKMPPPGVSVISVPVKKVGSYREFVARTEAVNQVNLRARVEGYINQRNFTEGAFVEQGQLLFELDRKPYLASLKKAEAELASSQAERVKASKDLQRSRDLFQKGHISQADLDSQISYQAKAEAAVQAAQAALDSARLNLEYTRISAPFSGKIGKERYSVGSLVGPTSEPLATLTSVDPIYVNFQVNESDLLDHIQKSHQSNGDSYDLKLRLPNGSSYPQAGTFNFSDTAIDEATGTLTLRAEFPNPDGMLYPGLYVTLTAESRNQQEKPVIPQSAVQENQSGRFVLVVKEDNTAEVRQVQMGRRIGPMWAVEDGLSAGEHIVVQGLQKVYTGAKVTPQTVTVDPETGAILPAVQAQGD